MKWVDKGVLMLLGLLLLGSRPLETVTIVAILGAVIAASLSELLGRPGARAGIAALWACLTWRWPVCGLFWPLVFYDLPLLPEDGGYRWAGLVPLLSLALGYRSYALTELLLLLLGIGLALVLLTRRDRVDRLAAEVRTIRDRAVEMNLLLDRKNRELAESRDTQVRLATLTERSRIAREIHDSVGHILARSLLQTGALIAVNRDTDVAQGLEGLRDTLTDAMNSVRHSVHDIRDDAVDLYTLIQSCRRDFEQLTCNVNVDMGDHVPGPVRFCLAGVIREAFSNVARHSDATRVRIDLQEHPAFYQMIFEDNGTPGAPEPAGPGMGLDNMQERVAALGGRMSIYRDRGFAIHIMIPREEGHENYPDR